MANMEKSLKAKHPVVVISGASGCGKTTIINKLMNDYPDRFSFSVSYTSRPRRHNEIHGKDYFFSSREEMERMVDNGELLEYTNFGGNIYGTGTKHVASLVAENHICVLDLDLNGVKNIKKSGIPCFVVCIKPLSESELLKRLESRKTETAESIAKRLEAARQFREFVETDNVVDFQIENDVVDKAVAQFVDFFKKNYSSFVW